MVAHHRRRSALPSSIAIVGALALAVSGCSSPDVAGGALAGNPGAESAVSSILEQVESMQEEADGEAGLEGGSDGEEPGSESQGSAQQQDAPPIKLWLPAEPTGDPAGWQRSPVECIDKKAAIGSAYVSFAVPGDWEVAGKGGGSGSPQNMGFDYRYRPADTDKVIIAVDSDQRDLSGALTNGGEPVTDPTFDYDYKLGDDEVRITFDSLGEITVGESTTELFVARPEQAPDRLSSVVYKARINQFEMPALMFDGSWTLQPNTFVVEVSYQPEKGDLSEDTVKSIVSSMVMPECSLTNAVAMAEFPSQRDVDGDGHISDQQDFMDALQMGG